MRLPSPPKLLQAARNAAQQLGSPPPSRRRLPAAANAALPPPALQKQWEAAQVVTAQGTALAAFLDSLDVTHKWLNNEHVAWFSGLANNPDSSSGTATHCSAFVSSVAERLGAYVLRPPEHSQASDGRRQGYLCASAACGAHSRGAL